MTKLQKYNQIIFAVFGSLGIILFILGISVLLSEVVGFRNDSNRDALLANDKLKNLSDKNLIQQIPVFNSPILLDSVRKVYLFPISQIMLKNPQKRETVGEISFADKLYAPSFQQEAGQSIKTFLPYGNYNNFALSKDGVTPTKLLFKFRVNVFHADYLNTVSPKIIFRGTNIDSNEDHVIDSRDLTKLYIYDLEKDSLQSISFPNADIIDIMTVYGKDILIINCGIDSDRNGKYEYDKEPTRLIKYSLITNESSDFYPKEMLDNINKLLTGAN